MSVIDVIIYFIIICVIIYIIKSSIKSSKHKKEFIKEQERLTNLQKDSFIVLKCNSSEDNTSIATCDICCGKCHKTIVLDSKDFIISKDTKIFLQKYDLACDNCGFTHKKNDELYMSDCVRSETMKMLEKMFQLSEYKKEKLEKQAEAERQEQEDFENGIIRCPKCGFTGTTTGSRGYNIVTGFIGSGNTVNRCGNCGHKWTPRG